MKITRRTTSIGEHEAILDIDWFAGTGSFSIRATGIGSSPEAAEKLARLMLGQARAELAKATTEEIA